MAVGIQIYSDFFLDTHLLEKIPSGKYQGSTEVKNMGFGV